MFKKFAVILATAVLTMLPLGGLVSADTISPTLGDNLIPNATLETASATDAGTPDGWTFEQYDDTAVTGTSAVSSAYPVAGHNGGQAIQATTTNFVDGDVDWVPTNPITVTPNQAYRFSDYYISDTTTEIDAAYYYADPTKVPATTDGSCDTTSTPAVCYDQLVAAVSPASDWTQAVTDFTVPANVTSVSIYHLLAANGTLTTDDYSLATYTPAKFNKPMISVTFDDGWLNQFQNAAPYMQSLGLPGTYYIISGISGTPLDAGTQNPNYMTSADVQALYQQGNEIGSHTVHHCNLAGAAVVGGDTHSDDPVNCPVPLPSAQVLSELQNSKTTLENLIGQPVTDFAYPYGSYDANSLSVGQSVGYLSQRTVNPGYNTKDSLQPTELKMYEVDNNITTQQVQQWVDDAIAQGVWLILCYHEVADAPSDSSDATYTTPIADFKTEMDYLASKKAAGSADIMTVAQALQEAQNEINGTPTETAPLAISSTPVGTATGQTTATVTWSTNSPASSQVAYGTSTSYGSTASNAALSTSHSLQLVGLTAGTTYHFQVSSTDANGTTVSSTDLTVTTLAPGITGDINNNGRVDDDDATLMYANWGKTGVSLVGDVNNDGAVNDDDATLMYANWSK